MTMVALCAFVLLVQLGRWQWHRALEKKNMLFSQRAQAKQPPLSWLEGSSEPSMYQTIRVKGQFLPTTLLLDNQTHQHQFGYDVLSPMVLPQGGVVLVDRGWVPGDPSRTTYPMVSVPQGTHWITGYVYVPSQRGWLLGEEMEQEQSKRIVVERVDVNKISHLLHKSVYPFMIRLGTQEPNGYVRAWPIVAMSPQRHQGYAVQWFTMAFVIVVLYVSLNTKKKT